MSLLSAGLTGLSHATPIFLVAAALTLVFGATRVVDFSQAALAGLAAALVTQLPFHPALGLFVLPAASAVLAAALEQPLFRRLERAPLLSQLLVTLGLSLLLHDLAQLVWATRPAPLASAWPQANLTLGGLSAPVITLAVIAAGPPILGVLLTRTAWPRRFAVPLAAALSGLAGTLCFLDRQASSTGFDLNLLADALLAVLLGGLGSLPGAFLAALVIGLIEAFAADLFSHAALVLPLALTATLLVFRPTGLLGRTYPVPHQPPTLLIRPAPRSAKLLLTSAILLALSVPIIAPPALPFLVHAAIAILVAASLHFLIGPGGIPSLGHAAFFVIGACASALFVRAGLAATLPLVAAAVAIGTVAAGLAALLVGAVLIRLSATALAMLTLVVAHLVSTVAMGIGPIAPFRSDLLWTPAAWLAPALGSWLTLTICLGTALLLRRVLYAPFGYALRAARDNPVRAAASGLPILVLRLAAFVLTGLTAGLAGSVSMIAIGTDPASDGSAAGLLMLALGGLQAMAAPLVGALAYTGAVGAFPALLGPALIAVPLLLPDGIAGTSIRLWRRAR